MAAERQLARARPGETLTSVALVHEAYLKVSGSGNASFEDRGHLFAVAARAMRQIIIDVARRKHAEKRGGDAVGITLSNASIVSSDFADRYLALDDALSRLAALDERLARIVELRFFAGLSVEETAVIVDASPRTVKRDWQKARAWLFRELGDGDLPSP